MHQMPKAPITGFSFEKTLVTDLYAYNLHTIAYAEGLLKTSSDSSDYSDRKKLSRADRQAALTLLLLFDTVVLHDLGDIDKPRATIPLLEDKGIVELAHGFAPSTPIKPLLSSWKPRLTDPRPPPTETLLQSLATARAYRPLILDRLLRVRRPADTMFAKTLGLNRREFLSAYLDWATDYATGNSASLKESIFERRLPRSLKNKFYKSFFDFDEPISAANESLLMAVFFAEELDSIRHISATQQLSVASVTYTRGFPAPQSSVSMEPSLTPPSFAMLACLLHEEGSFFPHIESIKHVLELRRDPSLLAFRKQFREFQYQLSYGGNIGIANVRGEIRRAKLALERKHKWSEALRLTTYISLPIAIVEAITSAPPIAGLTLTALSVAGQKLTGRLDEKSRWAMFGTNIK